MAIPEGLDRRFYEICALSELKNALRSGDIWVKGSRQFRDFDDYLLPAEKFAALKREQALPLAINPNSDQCLEERLQLLDEQLATVNRLAKDNELPDTILTESGLKITPLDSAMPERAQALIDQASQLLLRIKITELLMDVDDWTGFSRHFTHLKDGAEAKDRKLLLSAILGDAINDLGETKLSVPQVVQTYPTLRPLIGGTLNIKHVRAHWDDILRLASSIKQGTFTASLMLRKLGSYPPWPWPCASLIGSSAPCSFSTGCKALNSGAACMRD